MSTDKQSWSSRVIDQLVEYKRAGGLDFESAWYLAVKRNPPRGRDLGDVQPHLFAVDGAEGERSLVDFTKWAAREAWHNWSPTLRHLPAFPSHEPQHGLVHGELPA